MTPERWQHVKDAFTHAIGLDAPEREAYLAILKSDDVALHDEVVSLLKAHHTKDAVIDIPAANYLPSELTSAMSSRWLGRRIGAYELIALLGRGGMGDVFRARRADAQFDKEVAIKLVHSGYNSDFVLQRFKAERQILADLDHPNIARLLDGGSTTEGSPYLVMELVDGLPIDHYCEEQKLGIVPRLKLFQDVCAAVSYAHQHLIVHRDLKPSNILVAKDGAIKLLDFGIAKLLQAKPEIDADATMTALRALTPAFSSPEQILGQPITTATDVYSLGVVLFHLLTGQSPYRSSLTSTADAVREVCETEPAKPSTVAHARNHAAALIPSRDLDDIVLKALRKEPHKRYSTVAQFSDDIERYLTGQPVSAHGDRFSYRAGKFIKRHTLQITAATLIAATLIGGTIVSMREARIAREQEARAERHFASVRTLANTFMFQVHDAIKDLNGSTEARQLLVDTSLDYLNRLAQEAGQDRLLQNELAVAYDKVGDIQGQPNTANTGAPQAASESYAKSIALYRTLLVADPSNVEISSQLVLAHLKRSRILVTLGNTKDGVAESRSAIKIAEAILAKAGSNWQARSNLARAYRVQAYNLELNGEGDEAVRAARRTIEVMEDLHRLRPDDRNVELELGAAYGDGGIIIIDLKPELIDEAMTLQLKSLAIDERLLATDPNRSGRQLRQLVADHTNIGRVHYQRKDYAKAIESYRAAQRYNLELNADKENALPRLDGARIAQNLGDALVAAGHYDEATPLVHENVAALEKLLQQMDTLEVQYALAASEQRLASIHVHAAEIAKGRDAQLRNWRTARELYGKSIPRFAKVTSAVALYGLDRQWVDEASEGLKRCEAEVTKLEKG